MREKIFVGWQLLRGTNLALLVVSLSLILFKAKVQLSIYQTIALLLGTASIAAAGNLINDIFDQAIDEANQQRRIVGVFVTESSVWYGYYILNMVALLLAIGIKNKALVSSYCIAIALLYGYSRFWKCRAWLGNLVIAFLCALSVLQLLWIEPTQWNLYWSIIVTIYASFAFLTNWWRELIKDIEDHWGDRQVGCQTLVVQYGVEYGFKIAHYCCNVLLLWLGLLITLLWKFAFWATLSYIVVLLSIAVYLKIRLKQLKGIESIHQFSQWIKVYMLLGLMVVLFL